MPARAITRLEVAMSADAQPVPRRALRLQLFIIAAIMAVALLVFLAVNATTTLIYERTMARQAEQTASGIAHQTFASMFQIMREGRTRDQLEAFSSGIEESLEGTPLTLALYRGHPVAELYGEVEQPPWHTRIQRAFDTGTIESQQDNEELQYTFPLRARGECLSCHGDVRTIAEFVEDQEILEAVQSIGIHYAQGFYIGHPGLSLGRSAP